MIESLIEEKDFNPFLQNNKLVLVKFSAVWCPPCQMLQENIKELLKQPEIQQKGLKVLKVDVDKFPNLAQGSQFKVSSLPTFFLFQGGKMIKGEQGNRSIQWLKEFVVV